jgi:hypothetical protein
MSRRLPHDRQALDDAMTARVVGTLRMSAW